MRQLLTILTAAVSLGLTAQNNFIQEYPWNPDSDNDDFIGVGDLTGFLSVFGQEYGTPPEPCTYDGTPLEDLFLQAISGEVIIDSVFVEFEIQDSQTYYVPGCPDPITDTLVLVNNVMLTQSGAHCNAAEAAWGMRGTDAYGSAFSFQLQFYYGQGTYRFILHQPYLNDIGDGFFPGGGCAQSDISALPWPEDWYFDESGIQLENAFLYGWPSQANYLHILPYWHYAE